VAARRRRWIRGLTAAGRKADLYSPYGISKQGIKLVTRREALTEDEQLSLKDALEHIAELEHLMKKRPIETFKSLLKMNIPMELEIEINGATYALKFNDSD
jgi:hypothetical protein